MNETYESERTLNCQQLELEGRIWGHAPVQAEGTVHGKKFYFRAKYEQWEFSLSESEEVDPVDISFPEQGFFREAPYGKPRTSEASFIAYDEAEALIKKCAQEYINARNNQPQIPRTRIASATRPTPEI